jgi:hypothetical protein
VALARRLGGPDVYRCSACAKTPALLEHLGHDGPPTNLWRENLLTGETLPRCPVRTLLLADEDPGTSALARELDRYADVYFPAYEQGYLLEAGGVSDQPARYWELIGLVRELRADTQARYLALVSDEGAA